MASSLGQAAMKCNKSTLTAFANTQKKISH